MRAFRIGYIVTLSILIFITVSMLTGGFFPVPNGPTAPEYPVYTSSTSSESLGTSSIDNTMLALTTAIQGPAANQIINYNPQQNTTVPVMTPIPYPSTTYHQYVFPTPTPNQYQIKMQKYQEDMKKYTQNRKKFGQSTIVPYAQGVLIGWIIIFTLFEIAAFVFIKMGSPIVGGAYAMSGLWAVISSPWQGIFLLASAQVSSLTRSSTSSGLTLTGFYQAVGSVCLISVIMLTIIGFIFTNERKFMRSIPPPQPLV